MYDKVDYKGRSYSPRTMKFFIIFFRAVAVIFILLGLLLALASKIGFVAIAFGVFSFFYAKKMKNALLAFEREKEAYEAAKANAQEVYTAPDLLEKYDQDKKNYLAYQKYEKIAFVNLAVLSGAIGKNVNLVPEPENEYDNKAVAVYYEGQKAGYLFRGDGKDMVNDWIKRGELFVAYVHKIQPAENKVTLRIGFYKPADPVE